MQNKPFISVIVSFFNEEELLPRCIDSLCKQCFSDFEVILINDGSTDNSLDIVNKQIEGFNNFKVISINNVGLAEARNIGLKHATGEYITFLDADDAFQLNALNSFSDEAKQHKSDLIICDYSLLSGNGKIELPTKWYTEFSQIETTDEFIKVFYEKRTIETVWGKLFKANIAKSIDFKKGLWFEDRPYFVEFILKAKTVTFLPKKLLKIYCRKTSITRRILSLKRITDCHLILLEELSILKNYEKNQLYNYGAFKTALGYLIDNYLIQIIDKDEIKNYSEICNRYQSLLDSYKKKIKQENQKMKLKDKLLISALSMPKYIGWNLSNSFFKILKRKRLNSIRTIKNL